MKLYATLENSNGKIVKLGSNESIKATVYKGNLKEYEVNIEWANVGDLEEPTMDSIVTVMDWRNQPTTRRKLKGNYLPIFNNRDNNNQIEKRSNGFNDWK